MNRRNFIKLCAGAAVAIASGMELFKKEIKPWHPSDIGWEPSEYIGDMRFTGWDEARQGSARGHLRVVYAYAPPYDVEELKKYSTSWHPRAYRMSDVGLHPRQLKSLG